MMGSGDGCDSGHRGDVISSFKRLQWKTGCTCLNAFDSSSLTVTGLTILFMGKGTIFWRVVWIASTWRIVCLQLWSLLALHVSWQLGFFIYASLASSRVFLTTGQVFCNWGTHSFKELVEGVAWGNWRIDTKSYPEMKSPPVPSLMKWGATFQSWRNVRLLQTQGESSIFNSLGRLPSFRNRMCWCPVCPSPKTPSRIPQQIPKPHWILTLSFFSSLLLQD